MVTPYPESVTEFWFEQCRPSQWWQKNREFDLYIRRQFLLLLELAIADQLCHWRHSAEGRLAEIILLDQFSRNIWRDSPKAFAQDAKALQLAEQAISAAADKALPPPRRAFLYMPFMHSESLAHHARAVKLFSQPGMADHLRSEQQHLAIIQRFGRYPHRNAILGRQSTPQELDFLTQPHSSF